MKIPFNKTYTTGQEILNIGKAIANGKLAGDGEFTFAVQQMMESRFGFDKTLLTTSCTDALEMSALLTGVDSDSEVIMPSYTFVSTANAFALRGAKIIFVDSEEKTPNLDVDKLEALITSKTKVIVVMHYAGIACDMDKVIAIAKKYNLIIVEDAAQAINSYYKGRPLGSIGQLGAFSFHETKNIISGEGGMLCINDINYQNRAEIIREKGTNRAQFFRGEIDKYGWVDIGSSFLASEIIAAFLKAQLDEIDNIQKKRIALWNNYYDNLKDLLVQYPNLLPKIPSYATNNAHMFYLKCNSYNERTKLMAKLNQNDVKSTFHYLSLHSSSFYIDKHDGRELPESDKWMDCLLRLPMFVDLTFEEVNFICQIIKDFYND
jgi:dTDP-4-amino-4,6-dideoxygalactose transaminase